MEETDRELTRAEAAAYLSEKGRTTRVSTLAKYAGDGRGPAFAKGMRGRVTYKQSELDRWFASGMSHAAAGGRPRKSKAAAKVGDDVTLFRIHVLPMIDRLVEGTATFQDGVDFADARALLQRLAKKWSNANGSD
jgi:hypothetical protein